MKFLSRLLAYLACAALLVQPGYAQIIPSIPYNLTNGSVADATQVMGNFNTILSDVNANGATSGANTNITSLTGLTTPLAPTYGGAALYVGGTSTGSANAQVVATLTPGNYNLIIGNMANFIAGYSNSGTTTVNLNSTGVTQVFKQVSSGFAALATGDIIAGNQYVLMYAGSGVMVLLNPTPASQIVTGPGSSTSTDIATFSGTGGNVIQDSGILSSAVALLASPTFTGTPAAPTAASGTSTTQLATTAFANPATTNGSTGTVKLPGGTIIKWGNTSLTAHQTTAITFGAAFPTACDWAGASPFISGGGAATYPVQVSAVAASGISVYNSDGGTTQTAYWLAIGH